MKKKILLLLVSCFCISGYGLTENSKISVLTSEPGNEIYTIFGHTAIRITDDALNIDKIYNFGTFDFSSPFFYIKFIKGNLDYFLSVSNFSSFLRYAAADHRKIYEQVLDLSFKERLAIYLSLERCYRSDERFYKYDFFYDNCATRVRDIVLEGKGSSASYDTGKYCCQTFRQLIKPYIARNYWLDLGINLALGAEADKVASSSDFMFLPDYIMAILQDTKLSKKKSILFDSSEPPKGSIYPRLVLFLVIWLLTGFSIFKKTRLVTFYIFNSIVGIVGLGLLFIGLISDNSAYSNNLNILWTFTPIILILLPNNNLRKILKIAYLLMLISLLLLRNSLIPAFSTTFLPWIVMLIMIYILDLQWIEQLKSRLSLLRKPN
jgi:hypothetical protein